LYQAQARERLRLKEEAAALAKIVVETPGMKERRLAKEASEAAELKRKRNNSVTVKLPNEAKKKTTKKVADEYEKIYGKNQSIQRTEHHLGKWPERKKVDHLQMRLPLKSEEILEFE
jgi:hypothetical protein